MGLTPTSLIHVGFPTNSTLTGNRSSRNRKMVCPQNQVEAFKTLPVEMLVSGYATNLEVSCCKGGLKVSVLDNVEAVVLWYFRTRLQRSHE